MFYCTFCLAAQQLAAFFLLFCIYGSSSWIAVIKEGTREKERQNRMTLARSIRQGEFRNCLFNKRREKSLQPGREDEEILVILVFGRNGAMVYFQGSLHFNLDLVILLSPSSFHDHLSATFDLCFRSWFRMEQGNVIVKEDREHFWAEALPWWR